MVRNKAIIDSVARGCLELSQTQIDELTRSQQKQSKLRFVGLCSHIGGGKDYVANYLAKTLERKCEVVKFATKLTEVVGAILGVDDLSLFQNREWKEKQQFLWYGCVDGLDGNGKLISAREAQKIIGTDICRQLLGDNIWVDAFAREYNDPDTLHIISDLRFQNEFEFIKTSGGIIIYIDNRNAAINQHKKENGIIHQSEKLVWDMHYGRIQADYVLDNSDYNNKQPLQDLLLFLSTV
jgi:hypothetical protein